MATLIESRAGLNRPASSREIRFDVIADLDAAVERVLPRPIISRCGEIDALQAPLHPEESCCVQGAVERRVREFTAGRACARAALAGLGHGNTPIRMGARRQPLWPANVVGSITHGAGYCIAAVAERGQLAGLGVDIEQATPLAETLTDLVLTPYEKSVMTQDAARVRGFMAKLAFSAKESVFKCLYPVFGIELDFQEVELELNASQGIFGARVSRLALETGADLELHGRIACTADAIVTSALLHDDDIDGLARFQPLAWHDECAGRYLCGGVLN